MQEENCIKQDRIYWIFFICKFVSFCENYFEKSKGDPGAIIS